MPTLTCAACAKLNLALAVGPPRPGDGYHPICSWFVPIDLRDHLRIEALAPGIPSRFDISWESDAPRPTAIDWPVEKDLCFKAHAALERETGRSLPIALTLRKRIPTGGGLGGGSSDAAAMLRGLRSLFELEVTEPRLAAIALTLGSDVPYFLADPPRPALVEGLGESITPIVGVDGWFVLILPPMGCPTGPVYKAFDAGSPGMLRDEAVRSLARSGRIDGSLLFNDLAAAAERVAPGLAEIRARAARVAGLPMHITGSGSTLFIACESQAQQTILAASLRKALSECAVVAARTVG
jgi:4-diphosphocytidyl-2-C-methyl-D-erythritol kinase